MGFIKNVEKEYDLSQGFRVSNKSELSAVASITMPKNGLEILFVLSSTKVFKGQYKFSIVQEDNQEKVRGGSTFILQPARR